MATRGSLLDLPIGRVIEKASEFRKRKVRELGDRAARDERVRAAVHKRLKQILHIQRMTSESIGKVLGAFNISSRDDLRSVEGKLGSVEDVLAQLQVELRQLRVTIARTPERSSSADRGHSPEASTTPPGDSQKIRRTRKPTPQKG